MKKWFKIIKIKTYSKNVFGYQNRFFRIIKNVKEDYYFYGFFDFTTKEYRQLHKGIKIPINGLQITIWCIFFNLIWVPFVFITFIPFAYFDGAKNFIKNSVWYANVRFFNWCNILILLIFIVLKLKK